ncbi:hypothetical protein Tco_0746122 [Tanacetum coccineum]
MFKDSDFDDFDDLVDEGMAFVQEKDAENQGKIGVDDTEAVNTTGEGVSTAAPRTPPTTTTVFDDKDVTMAMAQTLIKMKEEKAKDKGVAIKDARIDVDYELAARMTQEEQEKYTIKERARGCMKDSKRGFKILEKEAQKPEEAAEYEKEKEELRLSLKIISNDDSKVNYEPLSRKSPIVNWEYQLLGKMEEKDMYVYKLTIADGSSSYHGDTQAFLRRLDRQDLNDLYRMIFNPDEKGELWMNQLDWKLMRWKLYENYGVHTLFMDGTPMEINMLVEKKYPLVKELLEKMLNLQLEAEEESTMAFKLIKFIKSLLEE